MTTFTEPAKEIPVIRDVDVVVAGGSPTGVAAAVAAARQGARVLLVERNVFLAGQTMMGATFHAVNLYNANGERIVAGLMQEIAERYGRLRFGLEPQAAFERWEADGGAVPGEYMKAVLREMVEEASVEVFYGTLVSGARIEQNTLTGVIVEGRGGRALIGCRCAVDATGDGELAARAGARFLIAPREALWRMLIHATIFRVEVRTFLDCIGDGVVAQDLNAVISGKPATLAREEVLRLLQQGTPVLLFWGTLLRRALAAGASIPYLPGTQERYRFDHWPPEQFRPYFSLRSLDGIVPGPSSAVDGLSPIDNEDFSRGVDLMHRGIESQVRWLRAHLPGFAQAELLFTSPAVFITESRRIAGEYLLTEPDVLESRHFPDCIGKSAGHDRRHNIPKEEHEIPYRCLVPETLDGLLVAGRCVSADREGGWMAFDAIRGQMTGVVTGQAAGTAAALAVREGIPPRRLDVRRLQAALLAQHVIL